MDPLELFEVISNILLSTFYQKPEVISFHLGNGRDLEVQYLSHGDSRGDLMRQLVLRNSVDASRRLFLGHNNSCQDNASLESHMVEPTLG